MKGIRGWFDFADIYDEMVARFPRGSRFVEIGVWRGRSTCHMAEAIKNSGKQIEFFAIDVFNMVSEEVVVKNLVERDLAEYVQIRKGRSQDLALTFDGLCQFIFIDGGHKFEDVYEDLRLWWPRVAIGGVFAGHDYLDSSYSPDVQRAVDSFAQDQGLEVVIQGNSWRIDK